MILKDSVVFKTNIANQIRIEIACLNRFDYYIGNVYGYRWYCYNLVQYMKTISTFRELNPLLNKSGIIKIAKLLKFEICYVFQFSICYNFSVC